MKDYKPNCGGDAKEVKGGITITKVRVMTKEDFKSIKTVNLYPFPPSKKGNITFTETWGYEKTKTNANRN